jgi:hypothetical protein
MKSRVALGSTPSPRNPGLPGFRSVILRKSGKPDLRAGEGWGGGCASLNQFHSPLPPTRRPAAADLPRKGGGEESKVEA